jgi:chloride channel 3/4/5
MPSSNRSNRGSYQRVSYREHSDDGPSTSMFSVNEDLENFAEYDEDDHEIEFEHINQVEADDTANVNVKYDDFDTIDWTRDRQQDRVRIRRMHKMKKGTYLERMSEAHDAWSGWLVVLLVGLSCGLFAGVVDIGTDWMFDLKEGVCASQVWLNKESCCWADNTSFTTHDGCSQWKTWSEVFKASSSPGVYVSNYFMFTLSGFLFALLCVTLVHTFAPYACGSGIPEVCIMQCLKIFYPMHLPALVKCTLTIHPL